VTILKKIYEDIGAASLVTGMFVMFANCSFVVKGPEDVERKAGECSGI
jgi:hypothetical protein